MKAYRLRSKNNGLFYKGRGYFSEKGSIYTSQGHIKNSLKQSVKSSWKKVDTNHLEMITYELTEVKIENL